MDEVDKIVLSSLKDIGYTPKEGVTNLKRYSFEDLLEMVMYCLRTIRPEASFPKSLPPMMSSKYQMCAQFAKTCKELGYKRDIGYHTFMYNNNTDIRNVLIFLVEHLPKKNLFDKSADSLDRCLSVKQKISEELKNLFASKARDEPSVNACQSPFLSVNLETGTLLPNQKIDCKPIEWRDFVVGELPFIDEQLPSSRSLLPSVITLNASGLINPAKAKSRYLQSANFIDGDIFKTLSLQSYESGGYGGCTVGLRCAPSLGTTNSAAACTSTTDSPTTGQLIRNGISPASTTSTEIEETISQLRNEISDTESEIAALRTKLNEISEKKEIAKEKLRGKMSHVTSLEQSIALLPDAENNIPKLEAANEKCRAKIQKLEIQWNRHKEQLVNRRNELLAIVDQKAKEKNELIRTIYDLRKELFDVAEEIQKRSAIEQRLKEAEMGNGVQRSQFITRILEMIKNIKKQEGQIQNILNDMKFVQKEINILSGKVERSFAVTERTISANSDELSRESHKLIVKLHKDISDVLTMIDETGKYARDIKDLEDQIRDNSNNVEEALKQVLADLERIKEEEVVLLKEIRKISGIDEND